MFKHKKKPTPAPPTFSHGLWPGDTAHNYEDALDAASVARAAQEEVFGFMKAFRYFKANEGKFRTDTASASKYLARRFLKYYGERIWGNDRKYMRAGLVDGGWRYIGPGQGGSGHTVRLIELLAPAFRAMRGHMFRTAAVSIPRSHVFS